MNALTTDTPRVYDIGDMNELPIAEGEIIYEGAVVGHNSDGFAKALTGGDNFVGFADRHVDNRQGVDGEQTIRVKKKGCIVLPLLGVTLADIGKPVYATDSNTFTLTPTGATFIGRISRLECSDTVIVDFYVGLSVAIPAKPLSK